LFACVPAWPTYWLDYPGTYEIEYERQNEPRFRTQPPIEAYSQELENFLRTAETSQTGCAVAEISIC
jgi:hypothetical protein